MNNNKAKTRIYVAENYTQDATLVLDKDVSHKLIKVLRCNINDEIVIFDGKDKQAHSVIIAITKNAVTIKILTVEHKSKESNLKIYLYQSIAKSEKMDFIIQKATELGVHEIIPVITSRTIVKLKSDKINNKLEHWQKIAVGAAEQSGRNYIPQIKNPINIADINTSLDFIILDPYSSLKIKQLNLQSDVAIAIGPEGGFSDSELSDLHAKLQCHNINLGPRILRTETAAISSITALQLYFGDLA